MRNNPGPSSWLTGVSCVSSSNCTAVGDYQNGFAHQTLVESWNGTAWSIVPSPSPAGLGDLGGLYGVSCVSPTNCTAVGDYYSVAAEVYLTMIESWDGTSWSIVPSPSPSGGGDLNAVSCVSATSCVAVGTSDPYPSSGIPPTLVESWDGTDWSIVPSPSPSGGGDLNAVSCVSAAECTAVGSSTSQTLVETWDGTAWSILPSPNPGAGGDDEFDGVSCFDPSNCTAVGFYVPLAGEYPPVTLVETNSLAITSSDSAVFTLGEPDSFTVTTSNALMPRLTESGPLPSGVTFVDNNDGSAILAGTPELGTAGNYPITITASDGVDPDATQGFTLVINRIPQAIAFTSTNPSPVIVGGPNYKPTASGGPSANPVAISLDSHASGCVLANGVVSFTGTGTCVVDANQAGNANYLDAPQVQQSIKINAAPQKITFTSTNPSPVIVGGAGYRPVAVGGHSTNPVVISLNAHSSSCTLSKGVVHFTAPGRCVLDANQAENVN